MAHILCSGDRLRPARPDRAIALGATLLIVDLPGLSPEFDLVAMAAANPWAVFAVVRPSDLSVLTAWRRHPPLRRLVDLDGPEWTWEATLRQELSAIWAPEVKEVVAYVSAACPDPTFIRALTAELLGHSRPARSTRHAAFASRGPLTASGWMGLWTILRAISIPGRPSLNEAAARLDVDPRTLKGHCHRVLELDYRDAQRGLGWKWAVERALRLHAYVADTPVVPLAFDRAYPVPPPRQKQAAS